MLFQTSLGIDIQDHSVSLAYLKGSFKGVRLTAHASYVFEKEIPLIEKADLIGGMVKDFLKKNSISPATVFLGIPREAAILRYVELPLAVKENLKKSLGYELEKYVPFSIGDIYYDYQIISENKAEGKLRILIIVAKKESVDPYLSFAGRIGIGISGIEIGSTAIANYFWSQRHLIATDRCAIVCLREDHLEVNLLRGGFLDYSKSINQEKHEADLPDVIGQELQKLKKGSANSEDRLHTVFCGFDTEPELFNRLEVDENLEIQTVDLARSGIPISNMVPAYSLALKGIQELPTDINLMPEAFRKRPNKVGHYTMIVLAGLLILSGLVWGGGKIVSQQLHLKYLNTEITQLSVEVSRIEQTKAKCKDIEYQIDHLNGFYGEGISVLEVLKELSVRIPKTAWVRGFAFSDQEVKIDGRAHSSSELIPSLESSHLFREVVFLSSITTITTRNVSEEEFRIGLKLK